MALTDTTSLSNENLADSVTAAAHTANDEQDSSDTTTVANTLAMPSPGGSTVTVFVTANDLHHDR